MTINEKEDTLFEKWNVQSILNGDGEIMPDGLLYRGPIYQDNNGYWDREPGENETKWFYARKRLLIITKDMNNDFWDIRVEHGLKNGKGNTLTSFSEVPFYRNLRSWVYGLMNTSASGSYPSYKEAYDSKLNGPYYQEAAIARINVKKQSGDSSIKDSVLSEYINKYKNLIQQQLDFYKQADVILCCGSTSNSDKSILIRTVEMLWLNDIEKFDNDGWIWFSKTHNKVVVNCWHPSYIKSYTKAENCYNELMETYKNFVICHP